MSKFIYVCDARLVFFPRGSIEFAPGGTSENRMTMGESSSAAGALPGADLIEEGARDLRAGRETVAGLLVAIGAPRLRRLGIELPEVLPQNPEHRLYALLANDGEDSAHSRYNALIRRLVSFERAAECVSR